MRIILVEKTTYIVSDRTLPLQMQLPFLHLLAWLYPHPPHSLLPRQTRNRRGRRQQVRERVTLEKASQRRTSTCYQGSIKRRGLQSIVLQIHVDGGVCLKIDKNLLHVHRML